jgi:hypothetical protein
MVAGIGGAVKETGRAVVGQFEKDSYQGIA